jgi:hypothetical protein
VERFNRTLASEWAYRQVSSATPTAQPSCPDFLDCYNHRRRTHGPRRSTTDQPTVTNLTAGCCTGVGQEITVDVLANDDCTGCTVDVLEGWASVVAGGLFIDPADGFVGTLTLRSRHRSSGPHVGSTRAGRKPHTDMSTVPRAAWKRRSANASVASASIMTSIIAPPRALSLSTVALVRLIVPPPRSRALLPLPNSNGSP